MDATLQIVLPIFGLIGCGYALGRTPLLSEEGIRGINAFVFYIVLPGLLFRTAGRDLPLQELDADILYAFFGAAAAIYLLGIVLGAVLFRLRWDERILMGVSSSFGNTVMLGVPLIVTAFGEAGVVPMALIVAFEGIILLAATTVLLELTRGGGNLLSGAGTVLLAVLRNPVIMALAAGMAWNFGGLELPGPVARFIDLLAGAAPACALAALGASLTRFRLAGDLPHAALTTVLKLAVYPLLVWLLAAQVFDLDPTWTAVAVILAAMPTGANAFIMAQRYDIYTARAASGVLISTVVSVLTIGLAVAWFAPA